MLFGSLRNFRILLCFLDFFSKDLSPDSSSSSCSPSSSSAGLCSPDRAQPSNAPRTVAAGHRSRSRSRRRRPRRPPGVGRSVAPMESGVEGCSRFDCDEDLSTKSNSTPKYDKRQSTDSHHQTTTTTTTTTTTDSDRPIICLNIVATIKRIV